MCALLRRGLTSFSRTCTATSYSPTRIAQSVVETRRLVRELP